jgi:hypothetical protein
LKVQDLKELQKLIQLCQKTGVMSIEVDGIKMQLGNPPQKRQPKGLQLDDPMANIAIPQPNLYDPVAQAKAHAAKELQAIKEYIDTPDEMTEEQMLGWNSRPELEQQ